MLFGIFTGSEEAVSGDLQGKKQQENTRNSGTPLIIGCLLFLFGITFLPVSTFSASAASLEEEKNPEALTQGFQELCRWKADIAAFVTLEEKGSLEIPKNEAECVRDLEKKKKIVAETVPTNEVLAEEIRGMVSGYPIEVMAPVIAQFDRDVAALIVGIAKKESNWGKRVPLDTAGADCFNYWGFKAPGTRGTAMGHGCFGSPEEAVTKIGNRLTELVALRKTSEPKNMIIWKCGSSCAGHSPESVQSWIGAVNLYYRQLAQK